MASCFHSLQDIDPREIAPGFVSRLVHTGKNTFNIIEVEAGRVSALHQHEHEQFSMVLEGQFEMTVGDETRVLEPGMICIIPSNAWHGGRAITWCKLLDVFSPVREDYKALGGISCSVEMHCGPLAKS